ncbi:MAG: hypothetical protein FWC32_11040 [Firmicutes bacterium]|nr:hypothetical protein [Bacillota bacterium]
MYDLLKMFGATKEGVVNIGEILRVLGGSKEQFEFDSETMSMFEKIIVELRAVADKHKNSSEKLAALTEQNSIRTEYCFGSGYMHRGAYCPSPIIDLILNVAKRGKIYTKYRKTSKEYYKYNINSNGKVISAEHYTDNHDCPSSVEYIISEGNIEYGIVFELRGYVLLVSKVEYENGVIKKYSTAHYNPYHTHYNYQLFAMSKLQHEEYFYENGTLIKAHMYSMILPDEKMYDKTEYQFKYNENGIIYQYDTKRVFNNQPHYRTYIVPKSKLIMRKF